MCSPTPAGAAAFPLIGRQVRPVIDPGARRGAVRRYVGAVLTSHAIDMHQLLADPVMAKNIFKSILHGVGIFLLVVLLIGLVIGLIIGYFIGKASARRD
jgi:hypothetical protein